MKRRFGRGRRSRGAGESKRAPIDSARVFARIIEAGLVEVESLEPVEVAGIEPNFAAVGVGERDGKKVVVGFAPHNAGDATFAAVVVAQRLVASEGFRGDVVVVAPQWSSRSRRRLAALARSAWSFGFKAVALATPADVDVVIEPEAEEPCAGVSVRQVAAGLGRAADRGLFLRAAAALEGLAAKHGGAIRGVGSRVELVLLASRAAALHAIDNRVELESFGDEHATTSLSTADLATAMDQLEGSIRKRLNDRRLRSGEEGLRARLTPPLAEIAGVRDAQCWPIGGSEVDVVDLVGVHDDGRPVIGAVRSELTLAKLAEILDAALAVQPLLPNLLADASPPLCLGTPRLLLAAQEWSEPALQLLASLALDHVEFDVQLRRGRDPVLVLREGIEAPPSAIAETAVAEAGAKAPSESEESQPSAGRSRSRGRGRRGGRRTRGSETADGAEGNDAAEGNRSAPEDGGSKVADSAGAVEESSFEELSLFDLGDDERASSDGEERGGRRSRRGRGRSRSRRRGGRGGEGEGEYETEGESAAPEVAAESDANEVAGDGDGEASGRSNGRRRGRRRGRRESQKVDDDEVDDLTETLAPLDDVPELDEMRAPDYEEDDEEDSDLVRRRREAEERARDDGFEQAAGEEEDEKLSLPRKRAAIVVHADRGSLISGVMLARDLRQIEGFWVYRQEDLMTFFRGVATDLFTASPARDTLQAAALYRGRLAWFDHRDWPPEDLGEMRETLGSENVHVTPGAESCLSDVLTLRERRSRFSDKIVELATGRFSQHDYERWGRLWWHRLGEAAQRTGERRADIDALLVGRPSDLAKESEGIPVPDVPPEVAFVSERDFQLVHFHGFTLVVVPTPPELDLHLTARIGRERYDAQISVARFEGGDLVVLGADDSRSKHGINLSSMLDHLASKHDWVQPLPGEDHVARLRIRDLVEHPERFDELISEIAMGRSILEG
ncbi:MAG: hypothetical protein JRG90_17485 [Deltaproteobacteria bacterium]|nr:hypothetical protein [Deltaproteobacteria bacterium]